MNSLWKDLFQHPLPSKHGTIAVANSEGAIVAATAKSDIAVTESQENGRNAAPSLQQ